MKKAIYMALALMGYPAVGAAASTPSIGSVQRDIQQLHSSRWKVRHAAQQALLRESAAAFPTIAAAIARCQKPEIAARLQRVGLQFYLEQYLREGGRRPLLGIRFLVLSHVHAAHGLSAVYVDKVMRGLPAGRVLRRGDLIVGINGHYFGPGMTSQDFVRLMSFFKAGDPIELRVWRGNRKLDIHVRLLAVPMDGVHLASWLQKRTSLISQYFYDLQKLVRPISANRANSPIVLPGESKHSKS